MRINNVEIRAQFYDYLNRYILLGKLSYKTANVTNGTADFYLLAVLSPRMKLFIIQ